MILEHSKAVLKIFLSTDEVKTTENIISRFKKLGFEGLNLNDLLQTLFCYSFSLEFERQTKINWNKAYSRKALAKLAENNLDFSSIFTQKQTQNLDFQKELFQSAAKNELSKLKESIRKVGNQNLNTLFDSFGRNVLHLTVSESKKEVVVYLINSGLSVNSRDKQLRTALHLACLRGDREIMEVIIDKDRSCLDLTDLKFRNAVHFCSSSPSIDCLKVVCQLMPALVSLKDANGRTPLHYAVVNCSKDMVQMVRLLVECKADVNAVDEDGKSCLHWMAETGKIRALSFLSSKGIDFTIREKNRNKTALQLASCE